MKRILTISAILSSLILSACSESTSIGIIGGADGPTAILVGESSESIKGQFGEQLEKKPIRMFNVDGELYYDSGIIRKNTPPRCGNMDGSLTKSVNEGEIPHNSGEANFETEGYQNATSITKEVNIDGEWVIFKKFDRGIGSKGDNLDKKLKYCFYIKGHLNNAAIDSELVVLTDNEDINFSDVYEPLLSSQLDAGKENGLVVFDHIESGDKWGLSLYADNVKPTGLTLKIEQFGGNPSGSLEYGTPYFLETIVDDEWQEVKTISGEPLVWNMPAYNIKMNDITEMNIDWEYGYGKLKPSYYRLKKEIMDFRAAGDYDTETYDVYFTIE